MVIQKQPNSEQVDGSVNEIDNVPNNKKMAAKIGTGLLVLALAGIGAREVLQSPEDDAREALSELVEEAEQNQPVITAPPTTRVIITNPEAPPATNVERPELTTVPTQPELSPEEQFLMEFTPTFSEIVRSAPVSPYDVALKVEDFPSPIENPAALINGYMKSMSLVLTHSYGDTDIINALYRNTNEYPFPGIDSLVDDAHNIGRFRFPPEDDPEYIGDKPNFGVMYRALETENLDVFTRNNGNIIVIQTFDVERTHFNHDEEQSGWFLTRHETYADGVAHTYIKQTVPLENDEGQVIMTEVWQLVPQGT